MTDIQKTENKDVEQTPNHVQLVLEPHQRPKSVSKWILLSVQHVFAMFGATVLVPMIINQFANQQVINISMALFCSGIGTLIYIGLTSAKVPIYLGSSFSYMTVMGTGYADWKNAIFIAAFAVGAVYVIVGFIIHWTGSQWVKKVFSPIVIGPIIIIIGMSAVSSTLKNLGLWSNERGGEIDNGDGTHYPQWLAILIGVFTILVAAVCVLKAKMFFKAIPILMALAFGYLITIILHFAFKSQGISLINTSLITDVSSWEWYPSFKNVFDVKASSILPAMVSIVPISMITMTEHLGEHINIGSLTNRDYIKNPGISRTLMADGVSIMVAGIIGGPVNATYAENTSVVGMTRVASVWAVGLAAIFATAMSFIAPINQIISMIPKPVMGGIGLILFGMISSNGVKILIDGKVNFLNAKNIFVISITLGIGIGLGVTDTQISVGENGFKFTGLFLATIAGVLLNILLPDQINDGVFNIKLINKFKNKEFVKEKNKKSRKNK
ncbi:uracil permease [Spiroplasma helicoides]|uniref:Uracil permease n=1 Tax=Spiroplasma helicoides TaxID=216938 RepID=A0A1B3SME1_9MOLU|nr:solute carrier family 23 protein [Spiroplasma helicoides]AOG61098.1 uracil permease [Spiroplasma helicoides]